MPTVFSILILFLGPTIALLPIAIAINVAGTPGALIAIKPVVRSGSRFLLATMIAAVGQSYVYLAWVALVVSWTQGREHAIMWLVWPFAFFASVAPIVKLQAESRKEAIENGFSNPQVEACSFTLVLAFIGFLAFTLSPYLMNVCWSWVPYVFRLAH